MHSTRIGGGFRRPDLLPKDWTLRPGFGAINRIAGTAEEQISRVHAEAERRRGRRKEWEQKHEQKAVTWGDMRELLAALLDTDAEGLRGLDRVEALISRLSSSIRGSL